MKKIIAIGVSVLIFFSIAFFTLNYFYPYYVNWSINRYADEVKEGKISKDNITLCSRITYDETVNSKYISFYIIDEKSQKICFECPDEWRLTDFKYLGFEKDSNNILVISADTGTYRYVFNGFSWKEVEVTDSKKYIPDTQYCIINNLDT